MSNIVIISLICLFSGVCLIVIFSSKRKGSSKPKAAVSPAVSGTGGQNPSPQEKTKTKQSIWRFAWIPATVLVILLVSWIRDESRPDSLGSGQTLLSQSRVVIEKHNGSDYSDLQKYDTVAEGFLTRVNTGGQKV